MGKVVTITQPGEHDWKKSPVMRDLMEKDRIRAERVLAEYRAKLKREKKYDEPQRKNTELL